MEIDLTYNIGVRKPQSYNFKNYKELLEESSKLNYDKEGFILHSSDGRMMKIKGKKYLSFVKMRGNTNNILFHYLELRYNDNKSEEETSENVEDFLKYFNEYREIFKLFEDNLRSLAKYIHLEYICRFVNKNIESKELTWYYRPIIYALHTNYYNTKKITTYDTVLNYLNDLHPAQLCFIYNNTFNNKKNRNLTNSKKTETTTNKQNSSNSKKRKQKRRYKRYTNGYNTSDSYTTSSGSSSSSDNSK